MTTTGTTTIASILEQAPAVAAEWAGERADRQQRTKADPADYARLARIGVPMLAVPVDLGGLWETLEQSARPICTMLRTLAAGDPSITLASAMHHLVLSSWRLPTVPAPYTEGWVKQRRAVFDSVHSGCWWGTIVSEPGLRRRHRPHRQRLRPRRRQRIRLPHLRPKTLRQRLRPDLLYDHPRPARRRNRPRPLLYGSPQPPLGRLHRHETHRRMARTRHEIHQQPRL